MKNTYVRLREKVSRKVALVRHSYHEAISRNSFLESRSAGEDSRTKKKSANIGANTISGPKLAEQYKVIADYKKEDKWDLNLKAGTIVEVVEKSESGWWFVNIEDQQGWVPSTYLKRKDGNPENTSQRARQGEEEKYICTGEYTSQNADEISLDKGAVVDVIEKNLDGWWWVRYQDKEGWTPATYLMKAEKAHMERVARASGVQIVGQLSDISNLLKGEGNSSADGTTSSRPKLPPVLKKSRSLERGGSLRPPPRQNSIKNINLNAVTTQKLQSKNYVTLADFTDTVGDGISFKKGEFLEVIEKTDDGWWFVKIRGIEGWAPSTYIKTADIGEISEDLYSDTAAPSRQSTISEYEYDYIDPPVHLRKH